MSDSDSDSVRSSLSSVASEASVASALSSAASSARSSVSSAASDASAASAASSAASAVSDASSAASAASSAASAASSAASAASSAASAASSAGSNASSKSNKSNSSNGSKSSKSSRKSNKTSSSSGSNKSSSKGSSKSSSSKSGSSSSKSSGSKSSSSSSKSGSSSSSSSSSSSNSSSGSSSGTFHSNVGVLLEGRVQVPGLLTHQPVKKNQAHKYRSKSVKSFKTYRSQGEGRRRHSERTPKAVTETVSTIKMLKKNIGKYLSSMFLNGCSEKDVMDLFPFMDESMKSYQNRLTEKKFCANHYWGDRKLAKAREIVGASLCQILESQEWLKFCLGKSGLKKLDHRNKKHLMPLYLNDALPEHIRDTHYIYR